LKQLPKRGPKITRPPNPSTLEVLRRHFDTQFSQLLNSVVEQGFDPKTLRPPARKAYARLSIRVPFGAGSLSLTRNRD